MSISDEEFDDDLTPTEFENLVFDISAAAGMRNVTWRTPGADGGATLKEEVVRLISQVSQF